MPSAFLTMLQYAGASGAVCAALIVSLDISRRWTGFGFVIFVCSSAALIAWGFLERRAEGIGYQNIVLLIINAIGVYRYLLPSAPLDQPAIDLHLHAGQDGFVAVRNF